MILNENPKRTFQLDCRKVITLIMLICVLFSCSIFKKKNVKYNTSIFDTMPGTGGKFGSAIIEFELKIPKDYNHLTQIDSFVNRNQATWIIGWQFSDKNFSKSTNKLVPGQSYIIKIFPILKNIKFEECLDFMKNQNAILVNAQGLTLASPLFPIKFPEDRWILSIDELDNLAISPDVKFKEYLVPMIGMSPGRPKELNVYSWNSAWGTNYYLLCFYERAETTK